MKKFIKHLQKHGVRVKQQVLDPRTLKAIQGEFDQNKIKANMEKLKAGPLKPIIVSMDSFVIDGNHRWVAAINAGTPIIAYKANVPGNKLMDITNKFKKVKRNALGEAFDVLREDACPVLTTRHMKAFEKFVDRMFEKFGINFEFTKHFRERMSDGRNDPCIAMKELANIIQRIYKKKIAGSNPLSKHVDSEVVLKNIQSDLNMPIAIEYDRRNDELKVIAKTIMRKKNFRTPNPVVKV